MYLSKVYFCNVYLAYASSKVCEFILVVVVVVVVVVGVVTVVVWVGGA